VVYLTTDRKLAPSSILIAGLPVAATRRIESDFSVMPDGEHFLMVRAEPELLPDFPMGEPLHVVEHQDGAEAWREKFQGALQVDATARLRHLARLLPLSLDISLDGGDAPAVSAGQLSELAGAGISKTNAGIGAEVMSFNERYNAGRMAMVLWLMMGAVGFVLMIACVVPARKASRLDPLSALRARARITWHFAAGPQARWRDASDELYPRWYVRSEQQSQQACGPQPERARRRVGICFVVACGVVRGLCCCNSRNT